MKRVLLWFITVLLLCTGALPASASLLALDESVQSWLTTDAPVSLSATLDVTSLMPFGKDELAKITAALKHIRLEALIGESDSAYRLTLGENELFRARESGDMLETDLLPDTALVGGEQSAMLLLAGGDADAGAHIEPFVLLDAELEREQALAALTDALDGVWEEKPSKYKIKSVGTSAFSRVLKLAQEQCAPYAEAVTGVLACGMDEEHKAFLAGCVPNKGITVAVYLTEEGELMAAYVKGSLTAASGIAYSISYQWGFKRGGEAIADNYAYTLKSKSGKADTRTITATRKHEQSQSALTVTGKTTTTLKKGAVTEKTISNLSLKGKKSGGETTLSGAISTDLQVKSTGSVRTVTTVTPELTLKAGGDASLLTGTVTVETTLNKDPQTTLCFTLSDGAGDEFTAWATKGQTLQTGGEGAPYVVVLDESSTDAPIPTATPAPAPKTEVMIDSLSDADKEALLTKASEQLGARLLIALYQLPKEDSALLTSGLTQQDIDALEALLNSVR